MSPRVSEEEPFHRPLRVRKRPLAADVADAIGRLVERDDYAGLTLPRAFDRTDVVEMLIEIAHTDDDGAVQEVMPFVHEALLETWSNRLLNSGIFQAGYKRYERRMAYPVVPVTDFFFKNEFGDQSVAEVLNAMSDFERSQSLPHPQRAMRSAEDGDYVYDEDGQIVKAGTIAGIVIFPQNAVFDLLRDWLARLTTVAGGLVNKTVNRLEHARPDTEAIATLKERTQGISGAMKRALPRPKR